MDDNDEFDDDGPRPSDLRRVTVDAAISDFLLLERPRVSGARLRRLERAVDELRQCFEAVADRILTTPELETRNLERQFQSEGAAARVADADALVYALSIWVEDSTWHGNDLEDRRVRVQLALSLAQFVTRLPDFVELAGGGCAVWDLESAVRRARQDIRSARGLLPTDT